MESTGTQLSDFKHLRSLSSTENYKYLGMSDALAIHTADMNQSLSERFSGRLNKVLHSFLSSGNKVRAFR